MLFRSKIGNIEIVLNEITFCKENIIKNQMTYDNILDGYFCYTDMCCDEIKLNLVSKFEDNDFTKKIFT